MKRIISTILLIIVVSIYWSCSDDLEPLEERISNNPYSVVDGDILKITGTDFGFVAKNKSISKDIVLKNKTRTVLTINEIVYPECFSGESYCGKKIKGLDSLKIPVSFDPTEKAAFSKLIKIKTDFNIDVDVPVYATSENEYESPITDGLIAYYPLNINADDYSGNNYNGHVYGDTKFGVEGATFDGVNDYIYIYNGFLGNLNTYTISLILNREGKPNDWSRLFMSGKVNTGITITERYYNSSNSNGILYRHNTSNDAQDIGYTTNSNARINNTEQSFVFTFDGSTMKIYQDGVKKDEKIVFKPNIAKGNWAYIGGDDSDCFNGIIRNVSIYNRALSVDEVNDLFEYKGNPLGNGILLILGDKDFGYVGKSKTCSKEYTVINSNPFPISIVKAEYPKDFTGTFEGEIPANSQKSFSSSLTPSEKQGYLDQHVKLYTDTDDVVEFICNGTSVYDDTNPLILTNDLDFFYVEPGSTKAQKLTVSNNCNFDIEIMEIVCPEGFSSETTAISISKGESKDIEISFTPSEEKVYDSEIKLKTDIGEDITVSVIAKSSGKATLGLITISDIKPTSVTVVGNITDEGDSEVIMRGFVWSTAQEPTLESNEGKTEDGSGVGEFTSVLSGLKDGTTYYVRSYATNPEGTAYGVEKSFTTKDYTMPEVLTNEVTEVSFSEATCGGNILSDGYKSVTLRGVVWSTVNNPTLENNEGKTEDGPGTGEFISVLSGLKDGTTYYVRSYATNPEGTAYGEEKSFTTKDYTMPEVLTNEVTEVSFSEATCGGNILSDGYKSVTLRGVVWSTTQEPTLENNEGKTEDGSGIGEFTSILSGLKDGTTYYVRSYATNPEGTAYGAQKSFVTKDYTTPEVLTNEVTEVRPTSVICGGNILSDGYKSVTLRGVVWSTSQNPTLESNEGKTEDGSGTGEFTSVLSDLKDGTTYYVRSYATNSEGTAYGAQKSFTTKEYMIPEVLTNVVRVSFSGATCGGNILSDGYKSVTLRGVVWSTSQNPTLESNEGKTEDGSGVGEFISTLSGLKEKTIYYVRSYATNSEGTAYGAEKNFTTKSLENSFESVRVEGGTFQMGSDIRSNEKPIYSVTLSSFEIGKYEITQAQWKKIMGSNPSYNKGDNLPVEYVSWNDVQTFIAKLNEQTGETYRLPTEAEWEFASRGGNSSNGYKYSGSDNIGDVAWYDGNSGDKTHPVGTKQPNELGIYDMTGNVSEWCSDWYSSYGSDAVTNPTGPASGSGRVLRGGSWGDFSDYCRVAIRYSGNPSRSSGNIGFRLARSL